MQDATPSPPESSSERRYRGGLDFWTFTEHVKTQLAQEAPASDHPATLLVLSLVRAATTFTSAMEAQVHRPAGNSWAAYQLLYTLWLAGDMLPSEAASLTKLSRPAITGIVNRLAKAGLVDKRRDTEDGRSYLLSLTDAGLDEIKGLYAKQNTHESRWANALTEQEQAILLILFNKLLDGPGPQEI